MVGASKYNIEDYNVDYGWSGCLSGFDKRDNDKPAQSFLQ